MTRRSRAQSSRMRAVLVATALYIGVINWAYLGFVAPNYAYMGMAMRPFHLGPVLAGVLLVLICSTLIPHRMRVASDFVQIAVFVLVTAPSIVIAQLAPTVSVQTALVLAVVLVLATAVIRGVSIAADRVFQRVHVTFRLSPRTYWTSLVVVTGCLYLMLLVLVHPAPSLRSFTDVYAVRAQYTAALGTAPLVGYLVPVLYNVANPIWMTRGLMCRSLPFFLTGAVGQIVVYSVTAHRAVILSSVAVPLLYAAWRWRLLVPHRLITVISIGAALSVAVDLLTHSLRVSSLLVTRLIVIPASLTVAYVGIFAHRPKGLFAAVVPGIHNPYPEPPFLLVGRLFFHQEGNKANANFFADGYFNLGWSGLLIEAAVVGVLLAVADRATSHLPEPAAVLLLAAPTIALTNSGVFTTILTHGVAALCIAAFLMPSESLAPGRSWRGWGRRSSAQRRGPSESARAHASASAADRG